MDQAQDFIDHFLDNLFALLAIQQRVFGVAQMFDNGADFAFQNVALQFTDLGQVKLVNQFAVNPTFDVFELRLTVCRLLLDLVCQCAS